MRDIKSMIAVSGLLVVCSTEPAAVSETEAPVHWTRVFDLDGDGENDTIEVEYTGGAHCCYRLAVRSSSIGEVYQLPFQLDGGYVGGLNLSRSDHFDIRRTDGPLPEIVMEIETYNEELLPMPKEWERQYGITTHYIAVGFPDGRLRVRDWWRRQSD